LKVKTVNLSGMPEDYERCCQQALWAGIDYLERIDNPAEIFKGTHGMQGKTKDGDEIKFVGICFTPESMDDLEDIWTSMKMDWTGAMHETVVGHLRFIAENGREKWLAEFKDKPERIYEIDKEALLK